MLYKGVFITAASGSVDGATFSHNRGGPYIRARTIPIDPDTAEQAAMRLSMSQLASDWREDIDPSTRASWERFSKSHTYPNRIGDQRRLSGRAEFFRGNLLRRQALNWLGVSLPRADDPPRLGPHISPGAGVSLSIADAPSATFALDWAPADHPWNDNDDACLVYISPPQPRTVNFFRSPFTLFYAVRGEESPPFDITADALAPLASGMRYFYRLRITSHDGRLSMPITGHLDT